MFAWVQPMTTMVNSGVISNHRHSPLRITPPSGGVLCVLVVAGAVEYPNHFLVNLTGP